MTESTWDSAFTAIDAQTQQPNESAAIPSETQLDTMNADQLAQTAERLLNAVQHDSSEKFQQSEFLQLMRKLRDRVAEVRGDQIVDRDAKGKAKAHGPPSQADLDTMLQYATPYGSQRETQQENQHHGHAQTLIPDALADLDEFWREEDLAKERASSHPNTFLGDGGDVAARMREDDAFSRQQHNQQDRGMNGDDLIAQEYNKWTSLGTNVPGASSEWQEAFDSDEHDQDFVGRAWLGQKGHGLPGAQNAEWAKLQSDWDEFVATSDGIKSHNRTHDPFPYETPAYRFHDANPYMANMTRNHAAHSPPGMLDTVLEHEAAVQEDPKDASKWYNLGLRQQENERETQAIAALHEALKIDPAMKEAWLALAVSYTNENDRDEALEALDRWIKVNDKYQAVVQSYQQARGRQGQDRHRQLANMLLAMARSRAQDISEPVDADVQVAMGVLFNASGEYSKAVDCFTTALHVRPDDWILYNRIGATLSNSGRSEESLQYYQQALTLRPDFARCHFNLSISCLNLKVRSYIGLLVVSTHEVLTRVLSPSLLSLFYTCFSP